MRRYAVDTVKDDAGSLRDRLHEIAQENGKVISVIWQPERHTSDQGDRMKWSSGYVIVSEYES